MDKKAFRQDVEELLGNLVSGKSFIKTTTNLIMLKLLIREGEADPTLTVPDIRNKLTPVTHLISMIERDEPEYVKKCLPSVKQSVNYLAQNDVYQSDELTK